MEVAGNIDSQSLTTGQETANTNTSTFDLANIVNASGNVNASSYSLNGVPLNFGNNTNNPITIQYFCTNASLLTAYNGIYVYRGNTNSLGQLYMVYTNTGNTTGQTNFLLTSSSLSLLATNIDTNNIIADYHNFGIVGFYFRVNGNVPTNQPFVSIFTNVSLPPPTPYIANGINQQLNGFGVVSNINSDGSVQIVTNYSVGTTLYVDATNGSYSTAIRGMPSKPFLSISNANRASFSNDLIYVQQPLSYDFAELKTNFVNYNISGTVVVTNLYSDGDVMTGFLEDSNALYANLYGNGRFVFSTPDTAAQVTPIYSSCPGVLTLENSNSIVHFSCDTIICTNLDQGPPVEGSAISVVDCSSAVVNVNSIYMAEYSAVDNDNGQLQSGVHYSTGNVTMNIGSIFTTNVDGIAFDDDSQFAARGNVAVSIFNVGQIYAAGNASALWWYGSPSIGGQEFINCPSIHSDNNSAIQNDVGGGDKVYVTTLKISSSSATLPVIRYQTDNEGTNQLWLTSQKVTDDGGGGFLSVGHQSNINLTNSSNMKFMVSQWEEKGAGYVKGWSINAGTFQFFPGKMVLPNGVGLYMTNGDVTMTGVTIDCSQHNSATNNAIYIASGVLTLNGCNLITTNGVLAIAGTNSPIIRINGGNINGGIAANLNWSGYYYSNNVLIANNGFAANTIALSGAPTLSLTNATPSNVTIGVTAVDLWFPVTNNGSVFYFPAWKAH